jgi:hypothetical protein
MDKLMQKIQMPELVGPKGLIALIMHRLAAHLGRLIAMLLHDASCGMNTDLHTFFSSELIANLRGALGLCCGKITA